MKTLPTDYLRMVLLAVSLGAPSLHAIVIGGNNYVATGPTETLTALFTTPTGGSTASQYAGFVQVRVSGTGFSLWNYVNDAFYLLDYGPLHHDAAYYQLTFGSSPLVSANPAQDAKNYIVYDLDAGGEVAPAYVPAYQSSHVYNLVLDTGLLAAGTLHFGVSDGIFGDNGGAFEISVTQLTTATGVPDAATSALLLLGSILSLGWLRRRPASSLGR
jgi:hypothetical protein